MPHAASIERVREILSDRDFRLTPQREAVLLILLEHQANHMTAEDIYAITRSRYPEIGLATIYRSLELFQSLGIISRLDTGDGGRKFEIVASGEAHYHHHLLCMECGEITEFNEDLLDELEAKVSEENGFKIVDHSLRFFGYCKRCVGKNAEG